MNFKLKNYQKHIPIPFYFIQFNTLQYLSVKTFIWPKYFVCSKITVESRICMFMYVYAYLLYMDTLVDSFVTDCRMLPTFIGSSPTPPPPGSFQPFSFFPSFSLFLTFFPSLIFLHISISLFYLFSHSILNISL